MSRKLLLAGAVSAAAMLFTPLALADSSNTQSTTATDTDVNANMGVSAVDAGKLIDKNVYDAKGDKVGDIESVIVDTNGKVQSVVLNVGGWLSTDKRISVPWKDLKSTSDGKITTSMTKEQADAAAGYAYKQDTLRGKVQTANGELFGTNAATGTAGGAATTNTQMSSGNQSADTSANVSGNPVRNADGSLNASQVIGLKVVNKNNEDIGKIGELVMGKDGRVSGVVVDVGGFLGIAAHPVLLDWKQVSLADNNGTTQATVDMSKDQLKQMPAYQASK
jgi:sporulation protein YlmC with PRC-barrel domain